MFQHKRNLRIRDAYAVGAAVPDVVREHQLSSQRVYQILRDIGTHVHPFSSVFILDRDSSSGWIKQVNRRGAQPRKLVRMEFFVPTA